MKLTKFVKLRQAIARLDYNVIAKKISRLELHLQQKGLALEMQNTAITQEGIFYIEPESGMATKVVAYIGSYTTKLNRAQKRDLLPGGYTDEATINEFAPYHILKCNTLTQAAGQGLLSDYTITKRETGNFYFRLVSGPKPDAPGWECYQEIESQKLFICEFCLMKVSTLLEDAKKLRRETFELKRFFDVDSSRSWNSRGRLAKEQGFMTDLYPNDWIEICRIRKEQAQFHCESCSSDLSDPALQTFLHIHPTDHIIGQLGYIRLECLCIGCLAEHPARRHLRELPEYQKYMQVVNGQTVIKSAAKFSAGLDPGAGF